MGDAKDNNETTMEKWILGGMEKDLYSSVAGAHKGWISHSHFLFLRFCFYFGIVRLLFWACM